MSGQDEGEAKHERHVGQVEDSGAEGRNPAEPEKGARILGVLKPHRVMQNGKNEAEKTDRPAGQ